MKTHLKHCLLFFSACFIFQYASSQDLIVKTNGDSIKAQITEVGTTTVTYKKLSMLNGPAFVENKTDISFIKYSDGQVQQFTKPAAAKTESAETEKTSVNSTAKDTAAAKSNTSAQSSDKVKIEFINNKYTINGQKASRKDVDRQLGKSKNPAILVPLKVAKMTGTAQKIVKITSIPTSIGGGAAMVVTFVDLINDIRRHRDNTQTYTGAAMSLVGTFTLPITNKILKKKSDKMHDKLIDMYNITN